MIRTRKIIRIFRTIMTVDSLVTRTNIDTLVDGSIFTKQSEEIDCSYNFRLYTFIVWTNLQNELEIHVIASIANAIIQSRKIISIFHTSSSSVNFHT
jgi:hypothetical protein